LWLLFEAVTRLKSIWTGAAVAVVARRAKLGKKFIVEEGEESWTRIQGLGEWRLYFKCQWVEG
jgi:hypothetical protein